MGKTYRREKSTWDEGPERFERNARNRKNSQKMKEYAYQEKRRQKSKIRESEKYEEL
jgi:hypothetical protein